MWGRERVTSQPNEPVTADGQVAKINKRAEKSYRRQALFLAGGVLAGGLAGVITPEWANRVQNDEPATTQAVQVIGAITAEVILVGTALGERSFARRRYGEIVTEFDTVHAEELQQAKAELGAVIGIAPEVHVPLRNRLMPAAPAALGFQGAILDGFASAPGTIKDLAVVGSTGLAVAAGTLFVDRWLDKEVLDARVGQIRYSEGVLEQFRRRG